MATNGPLNASQLTIDGGYLVAVALPLHLIFENHNSRASLLKTCLNFYESSALIGHFLNSIGD